MKKRKILYFIGSLILAVMFIVQMMPLDVFAADDVYDDPNAKKINLSGTTEELDETKTEEQGSGGTGYYDNGTYTNRNLLEAGDYYVNKQFDWTDKQNGKGKITFKTKLNVTKEPTRAVYAFTPCEAHGFRKATALKNIKYLVKNYDQVDLIWITGDYVSVPFINDNTGKTTKSSVWQHDYSDIHITKDVSGDHDGNGREDYLDILQVTSSGEYSTKDSAWAGDNGLAPKYWSNTHGKAGHAGVHFGISLYTGLYAYLADCSPENLASNPTQTISSSDKEPTAIYISFDGILDTRTAPSGVPFNQANDPLIVNSRYGYNNNYTYPLINYNCWPILYKMDKEGRYYSLGMNGNGNKNEFTFAVGAAGGSYANTPDKITMFHTDEYADSLHYQMWNELLALSDPAILADKIGDDGSFDVSDIPDDQLWNGVTRTNDYVSPGSTYLNFKDDTKKYHFDFNYQKTFDDLDMPVVGINLDDTLSDSFVVDGDTDEITTTIKYPAGTPEDKKKTTVNKSIDGKKISFSVNSYIKGTELIFTIPVKVDDQNATSVNKWLDTNADASLDVNLPDENPIDYDVFSPKAHIEGYHIDTEVIGGTIDPDRDVREGGSCTISYQPKNSNFVLDSITVTKYKEDGSVDEIAKFDTPEALQDYLESYPFDNVHNDWKISVVYVEIQDITVTKVWDDESDKLGLRPEDLTITLTADPEGTDDDPDAFVPGEPVVQKDGNTWTYKWTGLRKYSDINGKNAIKYDFEEDTDAVKAYEAPVYDKDKLKVTNKLKTTSVTVTKEWNDDNNRDNVRPETLDIQLLADGEKIKDKTYSLKESEQWTHTFEELPYRNSEGKVIKYSVSETLAEDSGYTQEKIEEKEDEESGAITVTISNKHDFATVDVPVRKVWVDGDDADGCRPESITVQLFADGEAVENKTLTLKGDTDPAWEGKFSGLPKNKSGEVGKAITYSVKEVDASGESVVPEGYTDSYSTENGALIVTNTHVTYTSTKLSGVKTLSGRNMKKGEFEFKLEAADDATEKAVTDGKVVLPEGNAAAPASADGVEGEFTFGDIVFKEAGKYKFKVSEVISGPNPSEGVTFDTSVKTVQIEVTEEDNALKAGNPTVDGGKRISFSNSYSASGDFTPTGEKTLTGQSVEASEESEQNDEQPERGLKSESADSDSGKNTSEDRAESAEENNDAAKADQPADTEEGNSSDEANTETVDGNDTFNASKASESAAPADTEEAEADNASDDIASTSEEGADSSEETDSAASTEGKVNASKVDSEAKANDTYGNSGDDAGTKQPKGEAADLSMAEGQFTFEIRYTNGDQYKDKVASTGKNEAAEAGETASIDFDTMSFTSEQLRKLVEDGAASRDDDGMYHISYYVVETQPDEDYFQNNTTVNSFEAVIKDNGNGILTVSAEPSTVISFTNRYITDTVTVDLDGLKVLNTENGSRSLKEGEFEFTVECADGAPAPDNTKVSNDAGGAVSFGKIEFTKGDIGDASSKTFTYRISETKGSIRGMIYDEEVKTVSVTVTDDGQGHLDASTDPASAPLFTFTNNYKPDPVSETVNKDISITKVLKGMKLKAGQFGFRIEAADDVTETAVKANEVTMPSADTITNKADGSVEFGKITYSKPGTYSFIISEVIPEGAVKTDGGYEYKGIKYDNTKYFAVVNVADDENGKLFIQSQKLSDGGSNAVFTNSKIPEDVPDKPDKPDKDKPEKPEKNGRAKTGDESGLAGWLALLIAAGAGTTGAVIYRKKRGE